MPVPNWSTGVSKKIHLTRTPSRNQLNVGAVVSGVQSWNRVSSWFLTEMVMRIGNYINTQSLREPVVNSVTAHASALQRQLQKILHTLKQTFKVSAQW